MSLGLIGYVFMMVNEKQMQIKRDIDRTKMLRFKANSGKIGGARTMENKIDNIEEGRSLF